jgi:hypothetical protein
MKAREEPLSLLTSIPTYHLREKIESDFSTWIAKVETQYHPVTRAHGKSERYKLIKVFP